MELVSENIPAGVEKDLHMDLQTYVFTNVCQIHPNYNL